MSGMFAADIVEDPLRCPLDVSHFADAGQGLSVVIEGNVSDVTNKKFRIQSKQVPSIDIFDVKPDLTAQKINLEKFLTPFQRFQVCQVALLSC